MKKTKKIRPPTTFAARNKKIIRGTFLVTLALAVATFASILPKGFYRLPLSQWLNPPKLTIVYDVTAQYQESVQSSFDAMQLALREVGSKAGGYDIGVVLRYNSVYTGFAGGWTKEGEEKVAEDAESDASVIAYIGPSSSGATQYSMPILNSAKILQLSIENTAPGLTRKGFGGTADEPEKYYPAGNRHYFRMAADDTFQSVVGSSFLKSLGAKKLYLIDDGDVYGVNLAKAMVEAASVDGVDIARHESLSSEVDADTVNRIVAHILETNPDALYYGGDMTLWFRDILQGIHSGGYTGSIMGGDGLYSADYMRQIGDSADGIYVTSLGSGIAEDTKSYREKKFLTDYKEEYKRAPTGVDVLAYDAMRIILSIIDKKGANREGIIEGVNNLTNFEGVFGPISFDENGDINQKSYQLLRFDVGADEFELVKNIVLQ